MKPLWFDLIMHVEHIHIKCFVVHEN